MSREPFENEVILDLVKKGDFAEQADLQEALKAKAIEMPQATLSRRLKKLNIIKVNGAYKVVKQRSIVPVTAVTPVAPNLIVIRTLPGHADGVAYNIDEEFSGKLSGVAGTIAGDDTIFVAVQADCLEAAFKDLIGFLEDES